jgi:hypothetical protein
MSRPWGVVVSAQVSPRLRKPNGGKGVKQIAGGARQPVKPRHRHHVARGEGVQQPAQLGAVSLGPARHFPKHFLASGLGQLARLRLDALAVRRYPCIAVNHAPIMHWIYATKKLNPFSALVLLQNS